MFFITRYDKIYNYKIKLHSKKPGAYKFDGLTPGFTPKHFKEKWFLYNYYVLILS